MVEDILTSGQDITQSGDIPYIEPLDVIGLTCFHEKNDTQKCA